LNVNFTLRREIIEGRLESKLHAWRLPGKPEANNDKPK